MLYDDVLDIYDSVIYIVLNNKANETKKAAAYLVRPLILEKTDKEQWNKYP